VSAVVERIEEWAGRVSHHFGFLEGYGFRLVPEFGVASPWRTSVVYMSATSAVAVDRSREYQRVEVTIARLKNGQLPPTRVFVTAQPFDDVLLDNVIEARAPGHRRWSTAPQGLAADQIDEQLQFWATALTEVAEDFLKGSFDALEDGERAVRDRMAGRRQQVSVWLPHDATDQDAEEAARRTRETVPPDVEVVVRRRGQSRRETNG
jgi:hypothetical protein